MRILLTGPTGQVGSALAETLPALGEVLKAGRAQMDLQKPKSIRECVRAARPDVIVNAAAYTAVDKAESDEQAAMAVNRDAVSVLGEEAAKLGAMVVHFSTDYVFDGVKSAPYVEDDVPNPLNVYGRSKLEGERALQASGCRHLIFRTSWVYGASGKNFMLTILRLAREGRPLFVVNDQYGAPTSARMLAEATAAAIPAATKDDSRLGLFHMTAGGRTSWYDFARAILVAKGLRNAITGVPSSDYPARAQRPPNSVLDNSKLASKFGVRLPSWDHGLLQVVAQL